MSLNERLLVLRKGYFHWLKVGYSIKDQYSALGDYALELVFAFGNFIISLIMSITLPLWFIPFTLIDYRLEYKRLKKRFADHGVDLTDEYQPKEN